MDLLLLLLLLLEELLNATTMNDVGTSILDEARIVIANVDHLLLGHAVAHHGTLLLTISWIVKLRAVNPLTVEKADKFTSFNTASLSLWLQSLDRNWLELAEGRLKSTLLDRG